MGHAIGATRILAPPVILPLGCLDQLLIRASVPIGHQITRPLPAQHRVAGDTPGGASKVDLALQEVQEERGVVQMPLLAPAVCKSLTEDLARSLDAEKMLLVWRFLVGIARGDLHRIYPHIVVQEVEYITDAARIILREERGVGGNPESPALGLLDCFDRLVEYTLPGD